MSSITVFDPDAGEQLRIWICPNCNGQFPTRRIMRDRELHNCENIKRCSDELRRLGK